MFLYLISTLPSALILILVAVFLGLFLSWNEIKEYLKIRSYCKGLPSPPSYPIIGNAHLIATPDETLKMLITWSQELSKTYYFWYGTIVKFVITDPYDLEIMMKSPYSEEKDMVYDFLRPGLRDGLLTSKGGELYHSHKKIIMSLLNGKPLPGHAKEANRHSYRFIERMEKKVGTGEFEISHFFAYCIGDLAYETILGIPGKAQYGQTNFFIHGVEQMLHVVHKRMIRVWLYPEFIFSSTSMGKNLYANVAKIDIFIKNLIEEKKKKYSEYHRLGIEPEPPTALFDHIINRIVKENIWNDYELHEELITMFSSSHDTLTGVGSFIFLMLAMHPEIQQKARDEVTSIVRSEDIITYEDTFKMKYMDMVIRETARMFPVGPVLPRKITGDIKLTNCTLPKGSSAYMISYATHFDADHWPEPNKFDPERFTTENCKKRHPYAYIGFSAGARSCPGKKYAIVLLKVLIGNFIRNYRLATKTTMKTLRVNMHVSTRSADGWNVSIEKL